MSQANCTTPTFHAMLNDGFVMAPSAFFSALAEIGLSKREFKIVVFIYNKTFGFHKTVDRIALSQFVDATGIAKHHVSELIKKLVAEKILIRQTTDNGYLIGFNPALLDIGKQSKLSQHNAKKVDTSVPKTSNGGSQNAEKRVPQTGNHNIYNTKYNNIIIKEPCSENEQGLNNDQIKKQNPTTEDFQKVNAIVFESLEEQYGTEFIQDHETLIKSKMMDNEAYCRQNGYFPKVSMALKYVQTGIDNYLKTQKRTAQITAALDKKAKATTDYQFKIAQELERKMDAIAQRGRTTAEELTDYSWANKFRFDNNNTDENEHDPIPYNHEESGHCYFEQSRTNNVLQRMSCNGFRNRDY